MKRTLTLIALLLVASFGSNVILADSSDSSPKIKALADQLKETGKDSVLVSAVKDQNQKNLNMDEINSRDAKWKSTSGTDSFMKELLPFKLIY